MSKQLYTKSKIKLINVKHYSSKPSTTDPYHSKLKKITSTNKYETYPRQFSDEGFASRRPVATNISLTQLIRARFYPFCCTNANLLFALIKTLNVWHVNRVAGNKILLCLNFLMFLGNVV